MSHLSLPASLPRFAGLLVAVALLAGLALSLQSASAQITSSDVTITDRNDAGHFTINIDGTLGDLVGSGTALEVEVTDGGGMVRFLASDLTPALGTSETAPLSEIALLHDDIDTAYEADGADGVAGNADDDSAKSIPAVDVFVVYPDAAYTTGDSPAPVEVKFRATVNLDGGGTVMSDVKTISPPETPAISVVGALRQDADGELSAGQTTQLTVGLQASVAFGSLGEGGNPASGLENAKTCVTQGAPTAICEEFELGDDSYIQLSGPATFSDGTSQLRDGLSLKCENTVAIGPNRETGGTCYIVHDHDGDDADNDGNKDGVSPTADATPRAAPSITVASGADSDVTVFVSVATDSPTARFHAQLADNNANRKIYAASTGTYYNLARSSYFGRYVIPVTAVEQIDAVTLGAATGQSTTVVIDADADLVLGIRNSDGQPSDVNAISSVTVTTTSGTIKVGTAAGGTQLCAAASTCNIPISTASADDIDLTSAATGRPSLIGAIPITLGGISKAGTATVSATVVAKAGSSQPIYRAEPITVTFSGGASSITLGGDAMPIVLNRAVEDAASTLDEASFTATATDSRNVASTLPRAVLSSVIGPDGAKVSSGITVNDGDDCGPGMKTVTNADGTTESAAKVASKCKYTVTVTAAAASALPAGEYTLRLEATGLKTAETKFAVAGPPANVEIAPDEPGGVGETFGATITVTDADGNSVADGTAVSISVNARNTDLGASVRLVNPAPGTDGKGATKTAGGAAKATFTVIGREISTINAEAGTASDIAVVNTTAVAAAAVATPSEGLSSKAANGFSTWSGIGTITASELLADLEGITSVRLWNGKSWLPYAQVGGQDVPGALDFDINSGDNLWLGG